MQLILVVVYVVHGGISADDGMGGVLPEATTMSYHTKTHQTVHTRINLTSTYIILMKNASELRSCKLHNKLYIILEKAAI